MGDIPKDYKPGQPIQPQGPHGLFTLIPPSAKPGEKLTFKLEPPPDMKVTIPKDYEEGTLLFDTTRGERISVAVPDGLGPGDSFEVAPPVLMVKLPAGAKPGDSVVFRDEHQN